MARAGCAQGNFLGYFQSLPVWDPSDFVPAGLFNVVHGWFVASFGRQGAAVGLLGGFTRYW